MARGGSFLEVWWFGTLKYSLHGAVLLQPQGGGERPRNAFYRVEAVGSFLALVFANHFSCGFTQFKTSFFVVVFNVYSPVTLFPGVGRVGLCVMESMVLACSFWLGSGVLCWLCKRKQEPKTPLCLMGENSDMRNEGVALKA